MFKNTKILVFGLLTSCFFLFSQCEKVNLSENSDSTAENSDSSNARLTEAKSTASDGEMVLGKKLENPYNVKNMDKALKSLKSKGNKNSLSRIEGNYYYVRLLPKTDDEYNLINSDPSIDTYEYPLDVEIVKQGNKYKDKSVGNNKFTWIYCAVPKNKKFDTKIKIEILDELYLPFGNGKEAQTAYQKKEKTFLTTLEEESLILTGNKTKSTKNAKVAVWSASGRIKVRDDRMNYNFTTNQYQAGAGLVPVPQCLVRANRWFTTATAHTSDNGSFLINHAWNNGDEVNYSIKWDRPDFDIRSGDYGQAYFNGPKQIYQWNLDITETGTPDNYMYAHVHRAANIYYYKNTFGVITPPKPIAFNFLNKIHLGTKQSTGRSHYFAFNAAWNAAEVQLLFNLNYEDSRSMFATTIHELTHAAHWSIGMTYGAYLSNVGQAARLAESWAQGVGWYITKQIYGPTSLTEVYYDTDSQQHLKTADFGYYTPIFIDLIDNFNQNLYFQNSHTPKDSVSGYSMLELQKSLRARPTNWYMYRDHLKDNTANTTETAAVQLFSDYD